MNMIKRNDTANNDYMLDESIRTAEDYVYEVLSADERLIYDTVECVVDTFMGVQVGNAYIEEPLVHALQITREMFMGFLIDYLNEVVDQGVTVIARDKQSGRVVGTCVAELYDPEEIAAWKTKPINDLIEFCASLDQRYARAVQSGNGTKLEKNEHIHLFFLAVKLQYNKRYVAAEMFKLLEQVAEEKGCKSIFAEMTNVRSERVALMMGYKQPFDEEGNPIETVYADHPLCKTIDPKWGRACKFYIKML